MTLDVEPANAQEENVLTADYYEILRVGPLADEETIERVYRTLADRFHPDNPSTGDSQTYLRLKEAYETLSDRGRRAEYNLQRRDTNGSIRFGLRGREFFDGVRGGQNRRLALLCLLYRQRISNHQAPGLTILELEHLTGCTREEVTSALWYLCEKRWTTIGEFSAYSVTAEGFDFVESRLEDQFEFRALASWSYYSGDGEIEDPGHRGDSLPLEIAPALSQIALNGLFGMSVANEDDEDVVAVDHYETLGIGPQSDDESIERVYRTLASRFHPDNPSTGDARTFLRIREAFETLSNPISREKYDALRQRTKYAGRFRLRAREFFEGMRGEQLRRLAVLCILYRQAASELPGLTVLDLEQLTGCTREELGSALWYLREKKWAKYGEFTEYSITAAGFDVVEYKLESREAANSRAWRSAENGNGLMYSQIRAAKTVGSGRKFLPVPAQTLIANGTISTKSGNSQLIVETPPSNVNLDESHDKSAEFSQDATQQDLAMLAEKVTRDEAENGLENISVAPPCAGFGVEAVSVEEGSAQVKLTILAERVAAVEDDSVPENKQAENELSPLAERVAWIQPDHVVDKNIPLAPESLFSASIFVPEPVDSPLGTPTEPVQVEADDPRGDVTEVAQVPASVEDATDITQRVTRLEAFAEQLQNNQTTEPETEPLIATLPVADEAIELPCIPEQSLIKDRRDTDFVTEQPIPEPPAPRAPTFRIIGQSDPPEIDQGRSSRPGFFRRLLGLGNGAVSAGEHHVPIRRQSILDIGPESWSPQLAEMTRSNVKEEEHAAGQSTLATDSPSTDLTPIAVALEKQPADAPLPTPIEDAASVVLESVARLEFGAEPAAECQTNIEATSQSPGVSGMTNSPKAVTEQAGGVAVKAEKRVIFSMGGKGGVGKTSVMTGLAEWFDENKIPVTLLDLDTENKAKGSLTHFFGGRVPKINIHTPAGLDAFVDLLAEETPVILADMGAGAGQITHEWFDKMYPDVAEIGVAFTAIGVVTSDPASVESVVNWAGALQNRVSYMVVENPLTEHADFGYWQGNTMAQEFRKYFEPAIVRLDNRLSDLENATRNYGVTLGRVACRTTGAAELQKASLVMRAQSYRRRMFAEFDKVKELLLP